MHLPVVISIIPVVKVHQKAIVHHVSHCGNTDQGRVHAVHSFKLHAHLEARGSLVLGGERGRFLSEPQSQRPPHHFPCLLQGGTCPNPPKTTSFLASRQAQDHSGSQKGSVLLCMQGERQRVSNSAWPHKERGKEIFRPSGSSISSNFQEENSLQLRLIRILSQNTCCSHTSPVLAATSALRWSGGAGMGPFILPCLYFLAPNLQNTASHPLVGLLQQ